MYVGLFQASPSREPCWTIFSVLESVVPSGVVEVSVLVGQFAEVGRCLLQQIQVTMVAVVGLDLFWGWIRLLGYRGLVVFWRDDEM